MSQKREPPMTVDLADVAAKRRLMEHIQFLPAGLYDITIRKRRKTRSLDQNAYYFASCVAPFCAWLQREYGDPTITTEQAHILLKKAVLDVKVLRNKDGEELELVPSTHDMDTATFSTFLEHAAAWLAAWTGIVVLPADLFHEK